MSTPRITQALADQTVELAAICSVLRNRDPKRGQAEPWRTDDAPSVLWKKLREYYYGQQTAYWLWQQLLAAEGGPIDMAPIREWACEFNTRGVATKEIRALPGLDSNLEVTISRLDSAGMYATSPAAYWALLRIPRSQPCLSAALPECLHELYICTLAQEPDAFQKIMEEEFRRRRDCLAALGIMHCPVVNGLLHVPDLEVSAFVFGYYAALKHHLADKDAKPLSRGEFIEAEQSRRRQLWGSSIEEDRIYQSDLVIATRYGTEFTSIFCDPGAKLPDNWHKLLATARECALTNLISRLCQGKPLEPAAVAEQAAMAAAKSAATAEQAAVDAAQVATTEPAAAALCSPRTYAIAWTNISQSPTPAPPAASTAEERIAAAEARAAAAEARLASALALLKA